MTNLKEKAFNEAYNDSCVCHQTDYELPADFHTLIHDYNERKGERNCVHGVRVDKCFDYNCQHVTSISVPQPPPAESEHDDDWCMGRSEFSGGCKGFYMKNGNMKTACSCKCHKTKKECTSHGPYEGERCPVGMGKKREAEHDDPLCEYMEGKNERPGSCVCKCHPAPKPSAKEEIVTMLLNLRLGTVPKKEVDDYIKRIVSKVESLGNN